MGGRSRYSPLQWNHLPALILAWSYLPECFCVFGVDQFAVMLEEEPAIGVSELESGCRRVW